MSTPKKNDDESTTLHLGKFAPGAKPSDPADTGATLIIKRAAAETVEQSTKPVVSKEGAALPPKEMLGAVSYCYAKGVYTSDEIEDKMMSDPQLREAVGGEVPDAQAIRQFRRTNRDAIKHTLEKAFRFLRKKEKRTFPPLPGQPATPPPPSDPPTGESTVTFARSEAEKRLNDAAFIDNMSKD